jgi:hypothetical protein
METYSEKLRHPLWQKKRLQILQRDEFACRECGDANTELHIHHLKYKKSRNPWDYENEDLLTLCKNCHFIIEHIKKIHNADLYIIIRNNNFFVSACCSAKNLQHDFFDFYKIDEKSNIKHIMSIDKTNLFDLKTILEIFKF